MSSSNQNSSKILLFSKYSQHSTSLINFIRDNNLIEALNINLICIDNENVRKKIAASDIEINFVPCLLIIKDDIQVDKFEGKELIDWVNVQFQQIMQDQQTFQQTFPPQPQMMMQPQHQPQHQMMQPQPQMMQQSFPQQQQMMMQQQPIQQPQQQMLKQQPTQQHQMMMQNQSLPQHQMMMTQPSSSSIKNIDEDTVTPIDLLVDDNEEDIEDQENNTIEELTQVSVQEITKKHKKKDPKYSNNSSITNDYNEYEKKNKKKDQKKLDLLNAAMEMKKSREDEDKSINKKFPNI